MHSAQSISLNDKLRLAASKGQTDRVLDLIEAGAKFEVDREGKTVLHLAVQYGHADTVAALLLAGCDCNTPDYVGYSPLQRAAAEGFVDITKQLLKHNARVDHQDEVHGNTALHEAAWKGYSQTLELLCKAKANLYVKNKGGFTALHLACQNGHNQSCRVLLLTGCKADIKNNYGDTSLHTAARYGHAGVMRILISAQSKVNELNKNADTALHIAVAMGRRKLTRILLEARCDRFVRNKQGETATDIAQRKKFGEVIALLTNPPTHRIPITQKSNHKLKKREKDSGTSSKESGSRHKNKQKKTKHGHKVHFLDTKQTKWSPYGCHYSPNLMTFPSPNLDSLPKEPLKKGEQYFLDLAGNICKGPVGVGYACYCAPFFQHVEQKLENDKQELIKNINLARADLQARMNNLERRTKGRLINLNQTMQQKLATEQLESRERSERHILHHRIAVERQQEQNFGHICTELRSWVDTRMREFEEKHYCQHNPKHLMYQSFTFRSSNRNSPRHLLTRSKSEEILSERSNLVSPAALPLSCNGSIGHDTLDVTLHHSPKEDIDVVQSGAKSKSSIVYSQRPKVLNCTENRRTPVCFHSDQTANSHKYLETDFDRFQEYTDSDHNAEAVDPQELHSPVVSLGKLTPEAADESEFQINGPFFDTVSNEMEKWYERRLMKMEKNAQQKIDCNREAFEGRIQAIEDKLTKINESFSLSGGSRSGSSLV